MERLTDKAHEIVLSHLQPGDVAIDATAGNGFDTLFLAEAVEDAGLVFAFDVQPAAIEQAAARLEDAGQTNVQLLLQSHAEMANHIPAEYHGRIAAVMFNLGYLPGSDKSFLTEPETTRSAILSALCLLRAEGVLSVLAYTGHPGGLEEAAEVMQLFQSLSPEEFTVEIHIPNRPQAPQLFVVTRRHNP